MRKARLWIGLAMVTLVVWGMGLSAFAEPKPSDFLMEEFVGGELGAIGGGVLGVGMVNVIASITGASSRCDGWEDCLSGALLGVNLGRALGASTGVILAGTERGVEGNIWGAYLATGLWSVVSPIILAKTLIKGSRQDELLLLAFLSAAPGIPAALATIGYNIGAKLKSDKSKPAALSWSLPVVALRF